MRDVADNRGIGTCGSVARRVCNGYTSDEEGDEIVGYCYEGIGEIWGIGDIE